MSTHRQPGYHEIAYLDRESIPHLHLVIAAAVTDAVIETFDVDRDLVRTIPVVSKKQGSPQAAVVYTGDALDMGHAEDIAERDSDCTLKLPGDLAVDSREGMIYPVFEQMIRVLSAQYRATGKVFRPNQLPKVYPNQIHRTRTWLTGYESDDGLAMVGVVQQDGQPTIQPRLAQETDPTIGFRPAAIIGPRLVAEYVRLHPESQDPLL